MLGASPGSEERAISLEPSESEAKKKYKKKMNVRHYRAQNKDAMTQLRDVLPERMRPPERQAKAYVTLSGTSCFFLKFVVVWRARLCLIFLFAAQQSHTFESSRPRMTDCGRRI
jgi:hypothetical protein